MTRHYGLAIVWALLSVFGGCRQTSSSPPSDNASTSGNSALEPQKAAMPASAPTRVDLPMVGDDIDRWLHVEKAREGSKGGYATGDFDRARNKISIVTTDVERFAIDTTAIRVNWRKPVVLNINGANSELRQREGPRVVFELSPNAGWIVVEEKK